MPKARKMLSDWNATYIQSLALPICLDTVVRCLPANDLG